MAELKINPKFRILSAFAIIFVVAGHADFGVFDVAGVFPYYSFHVGVFAFISGYFYKEEYEKNIKKYLIKKAKHLLVPYYIWNLFYGLMATVLRIAGFSIGSEITLKSLLIDPFLGGHQYGLNFAAWFVPVLFLVEVMNIFMRKLWNICFDYWGKSLFQAKNGSGMFSENEKKSSDYERKQKVNSSRTCFCKKETVIFAGTLLMGMLVVGLAIRGSVWGYYKHIGCVLFLFPVFQAGQFYKKKLEHKVENISLVLYFAIILLLQYMVLLRTHGQIAYSTVWCSGFLYEPWIPYITTFTGIAFWLGIARVLEPLWKEGNLLDLIGKNTFSICMHHVTGFMVLNTIFFFLAATGKVMTDFDVNGYLGTYEYRYLPMGMENGKWLYLVFGIVISLLISRTEQRIKVKRG